MKKIISLSLSLIMIMTTLFALPLQSFAADWQTIDSGTEINVYTAFGDGTDLVNGNAYNIVFNKSNLALAMKTVTATDSNNASATVLDKSKEYYKVTFSFFIQQGDDYRVISESQKTNGDLKVFVNGQQISGSELVLSQEYNGSDPYYGSQRYFKLSIPVYFYNVAYDSSYKDGEFIGFYNSGVSVSVQAATVPEGKYFKEWKVSSGVSGTTSATYANSTTFNTGVRWNKVKPVFGDQLKVYIDGHFNAGEAASSTGLSISADGANVESFKTTYKNPGGTTVTEALREDYPYYTMNYKFKIYKDESYVTFDNSNAVCVILNGKALYASNVGLTDGGQTVSVNAGYYNVTLDDECLGFFPSGSKLAISAKEVEGKHFKEWTGIAGGYMAVEFDDAKSASTNMTVNALKNVITSSYEDHDFGDNAETCAVCGIANPNYVPPVIDTKENTLSVKAKKVKVKFATLKKKKVTIKRAKALTVKNAKGKVTYKKTKGSKKITVNKKTGKITIKKGLKKGTYKIKIKVTAAGNGEYAAASKTVTVKITVK